MTEEKITHAELKELLYYDEFTGMFTWLKTNSNRRKAGARAGSVESKNWGQAYVFIRLNKRVYRAHTLAHFYMTGEWPPMGIKSPHANGDGTDNRWINLCEAYGYD